MSFRISKIHLEGSHRRLDWKGSAVWIEVYTPVARNWDKIDANRNLRSGGRGSRFDFELQGGIFLLAIVTVLLYYIVAPLEERELREQYGAQYEAYARTVPRFVPRLGRKTKPQEL